MRRKKENRNPVRNEAHPEKAYLREIEIEMAKIEKKKKKKKHRNDEERKRNGNRKASKAINTENQLQSAKAKIIEATKAAA